MIAKIEPSHLQSNSKHDAAGRLTTATLAGAGSRPAVAYAYGYTAAGGCGADTGAGMDSARVTQTVTVGAGTPAVTTSCTDYASRLTSASGANALSSVTYNGHGDATVMGAQTITYAADDRVTAVNNNAGGVNQTVTYTLDAQDRLINRVASGTGTGAENSINGRWSDAAAAGLGAGFERGFGKLAAKGAGSLGRSTRHARNVGRVLKTSAWAHGNVAGYVANYSLTGATGLW